MTAGEEAAALEIPREQVAKTLVLVTEGGYVRAVLPSGRSGSTCTRHASFSVTVRERGWRARKSSRAPIRCSSWARCRRSAALRATARSSTAGSHAGIGHDRGGLAHDLAADREQDLLSLTKAELADLCAD